MSKTLHNTCASGTTTNVSDVIFWGNDDAFKLVAKASSESEGWMKSTKAMDTGNGCLVQVTTQQRNEDGSYAVAEALTFVPNVVLLESREKVDGPITSRWMVPQHVYDAEWKPDFEQQQPPYHDEE